MLWNRLVDLEVTEASRLALMLADAPEKKVLYAYYAAKSVALLTITADLT